jgi:hypothetical protein
MSTRGFDGREAGCGPVATDVSFEEAMLRVTLGDGREIAVPLDWFPRLRCATPEELAAWRLVGGGVGIHWETLDEDLSVVGLLTC